MESKINYLISLAIKSFEESNLKNAEFCLNQANKLQPKNFEVLRLLGVLNEKLGNVEQAINYYKKSLTEYPKNLYSLINLGNIYLANSRFKDALEIYLLSTSINSFIEGVWTNIGICFLNLNKPEDAIISHDKALRINPNYVEAYSNKGNVFFNQNNFYDAIDCYKKALNINPFFCPALFNIANSYNMVGNINEAINSFQHLITLDPNNKDALFILGRTYRDAKKYLDALICFEQLLNQDTNYPFLKGDLLHTSMIICNWNGYQTKCESIHIDLKNSLAVVEPFAFQAISNDEFDLKVCSEIYYKNRHKSVNTINKNSFNHSKINVGYLCGEFREQATSVLMTELWELHNKNNFSLFAFDNGWDDNSDRRKRIVNAFDSLIDIRNMDDYQTANLIYSHEIDILVNLNGYFGNARTGIFSLRPAPIQVNYLGFPGTIGSDCIDYIIADPITIPIDSRQYYSEKVVHLPNCYQVNDRKRKISDKKFTRKDFNLPETGFVFCCFNNNYKIIPTIFDLWIQILKQVDGSVLWLLQDNIWAAENLKREAQVRGLNPDRIIFAERMNLADHLARHRLADLFLDTFPYNAHTTASDALWAGLPLLTLKGNTFPSRVAASLINAIGLNELITQSTEDYKALAIELAFNKEKLLQIRNKLNQNRLTKPLFNTELFTKNIETAYMMMYERYRAKLMPDHIVV